MGAPLSYPTRPLSPGFRGNRYVGEHQANTGSASAYQTDTSTGTAQAQAFDTAPLAPLRIQPTASGRRTGPSAWCRRCAGTKNYIVSQTKTGMILVDQHAARTPDTRTA